ncbi:MAG: Rieske 2Fe-2S domain-containing protein [bacterium]
MSHGFSLKPNARKLLYDACVVLCIGLYLLGFIQITRFAQHDLRGVSELIAWMRALSTCAFWMLTVVLSIGPLARLHRVFLPLLYNRRHLGVCTFVVALAHAAVAVYFYHASGTLNPILSIFASGGALPFQALGALALLILCAMAITSHDFWNARLGAPKWKTLHMLVYLAYALIVAHIALGALQQGGTGLLPWMALASVLWLGALHCLAALRPLLGAGDATRIHSAANMPGAQQWVAVARWRDIPDNRAVVASIGGGERIALFRYDRAKLAAVSNVCAHQGGPLGEGRVVDGLITCPWHGFQYRPEDGCSPPPFNERIQTYRLKIEADQVFVDPTPLPAGAPRPVAEIPAAEMRDDG